MVRYVCSIYRGPVLPDDDVRVVENGTGKGGGVEVKLVNME